MDWKSKWCWITSSASRTKTKVIYVMEIAETWIKMINCYEELPLFPLRKQVICVKKMQETWTEIAMGYESIPMLPERKQVIYVKKTGEVAKWTYEENGRNMDWNQFPCFQNENKSLCQENVGNMKIAWISPSSRTKTKVIYVKKKQEHGFKWQSVINNFFYFHNEKKKSFISTKRRKHGF